MKETEFAKLLGDLPENYILQAQAHRSGGRYAGGARRPVLKFAAVAAAAALMLGGFFWALERDSRAVVSQQAASVQEDEKTWQREIVEGTGAFWSDSYEDSLTLEEYAARCQAAGMDCAPRAYAVLDVDRDGQEELAVRFAEGEADVLTLILGRTEDKIVSAAYTDREMRFLKEDGTFYYCPNGLWGWGKLTRWENGWLSTAQEPRNKDNQQLSDAAWSPMPGTDALPDSSRASCKELGASVSGGGSLVVMGALTEKTGYSLYVPIEGWSYERTSVGQYEADSWYYDKDPQTRLTVFPTDLETMTWQKPGYTVQKHSRYSLTMHKGERTETGRTLHVQLRLGETTNYVIQVEYADAFPDRNVLGSMEDGIQFLDSAALNRAAESEFSIEVYEGRRMQTHLAVEEGYSLYIPDDMNNVRMDAVTEAFGTREGRSWYGEAGESLSVVDLGETGQAEAVAWARETLEWSSTEDTGVDGWIRGVCADMQVEVRILNRSDSGCYAVILRCPKDATEARWRVLDTMAGSIQFS